MKTSSFADFKTSEVSEKVTSNFKIGASGLPNDSDRTGILVDKPNILFPKILTYNKQK